MNDTIKNIRPDSFSGLIFGLEALRGGAVILNGPTGCKFYHSATVDGNTFRSLSFDPLQYPEEFYFGQGRVPCTYLDSHDYVYGSKEKLTKLLKEIRGRDRDFVAVINSPGAALIGDDLTGILEEYPPAPINFAIDTPGFSAPYGEGLQRGLIAMAEHLDLPKRKVKKNQVNLLGFHLFQKHPQGNLKELKRLLHLGGIETGTAFYECNIEELKVLSEGALNIVTAPETGLQLAKYLKDRFGTEYIVPRSGQPLGFAAGEEFFKELAEVLPLNPEPIMEEYRRARGRAYLFLARYSSVLGKPKGATYRIRGDASLIWPAVRFFTDYLGMIPLEILPEGEDNGEFIARLKEFAEPFCTLGPQPDASSAQMVAGDGNDVASSVQDEEYLFGLELSQPSMGYLDVTEKTLYGPTGTLYLLEQILNGLKFS